MAAGASASLDELPGIVEGLRDQFKASQAARRTLAGQLHGYRAAELVASTAAGPDGVRRIMEQAAGGTVEDLRALAQAVTSHPKVFFAGVLAQPATLLLAASADAGLDAGALLQEVLGKLGGKGGGTARLAQGGVASPEELPAALRALGFG